MDLQAFLNGLNNLISYPGDRDEFNNKFFAIILDKTLSECIDKYKPGEKLQIQKDFNKLTDNQLFLETVNKYFTKEQFNELLKISAQSVMEDYLNTIDSELTDGQREKIVEYLAVNKPQE